ncbi:MAG: hypothetical protein KJ606_07880 [Chloroflexi bacterium]|nr:hypothetical protein [Chloroflexota bacterium]
MKKTIYLLATLATIITMVMGTYTSAKAASSPALVTDKIVNIAYFYKPPTNSDAGTLAKNFNTFILTRADETFRDDLIANGVTSPIMQYVRFEAIMDPGSCTAKPWRNNVAYKVGDFCNISTQHPDWFLLDANGNRILVDEKYYLMDPGNQEWREFWLTRTRESQEELGWYGVFLDNVEASLYKVIQLAGVPQQYPDDASYQAAIQGFLQYIYTSYFQPQGRPLMANIISLSDPAVWFAYLQYLDGAMDEAWAIGWRTNYRSVSEWEEELTRAERTQAIGKYAVLISQGDQANINRQAFAFGSYLLISNGTAAFRYTNSYDYGQAWLYPNYEIDLGSPLGPRYPQGNLWRRDFTKGSVIVDPVNHTAEITTGTAPTATATQPAATPTVAPIATATPTEPAATPTVASSATPTEPAATPTTAPTSTPTETSVPQPTGTPVAVPSATPAPKTTTVTYDNTDPAFIYSSGWSNTKDKSSYKGSFMRTAILNASATFTFTGQSFSILYNAGSKYGNLDIYVDGVSAGSINQKASANRYQQRWDYPGQLSSGTHELRMVFSGPKKAQASLDGVIVTQPLP